jgi:hypothetical protein
MVSKKVCHTTVVQKLREEIDFLETGCFQPRVIPLRLADLTPPPKNYLYRVVLVLKISLRSFHFIKSYSHFYEGQTDRQISPSIYGTDKSPHPYTGG